MNKHNNILYAVPYQHFTNSIEKYFSMLKSRLQKLDGLKYENLKENINKLIGEIPKEKIWKYIQRCLWTTWKICSKEYNKKGKEELQIIFI